MPWGPSITDIERGQILALHKKGLSFRNNVQIGNRSVRALQSVLPQGFKHKHPKHCKGDQKTSETQKRPIIREALKDEDSVRTIKAELKLTVGHLLFQQILSAVPYLKYKKMIKAPQMIPQHK